MSELCDFIGIAPLLEAGVKRVELRLWALARGLSWLGLL